LYVLRVRKTGEDVNAISDQKILYLLKSRAVTGVIKEINEIEKTVILY